MGLAKEKVCKDNTVKPKMMEALKGPINKLLTGVPATAEKKTSMTCADARRLESRFEKRQLTGNSTTIAVEASVKAKKSEFGGLADSTEVEKYLTESYKDATF